jgi:hypothetical protein
MSRTADVAHRFAEHKIGGHCRLDINPRAIQRTGRLPIGVTE